MSHPKNIIINAVDRWFHYEKPLPIEMPRDVIMHTLKDHEGNDVICWLGWADFELDGALWNG